jgi:hypothetical protein
MDLVTASAPALENKMPIDTSIYNNIQAPKFESPVNMLMQGMQLQNAQNQNKLATLQFENAERDVGADKALAGFIAQGKKPDEIAQGIAGAGFGKQSLAFSKQQREAMKEQISLEKEKVGFVAQLLGSSTDQATYSANRAKAQAAGIDLSNTPEQFDPKFVQSTLKQALTASQQLEQVWKKLEFDRDGEKFDETKRHNRSTEGIAGANLSVSRDRLNLEKSNAKGQYDADRGVLVDTRTGVTRPVLDSAGKPIGPKDTGGTVDERNAAGYASRMSAAEKIITKVATEDGGAQKPGAIEAVLGGNNMVSNASRSSARQQYRQGQEDWVRAKLRKESGAAIPNDEMEREITTYFPQPGDKPAVIEQKTQARKVAENAMRQSAGKAGRNIDSVADSGGSANAPKVGTTMDGYRFKGGNPADRNSWEKM